jgi:beta-phosphoglucomutase-like phosphatase (HAD superfamily)
MLRAIVFDVAGTLTDTEELHRRAFNDPLAALGLRLAALRALLGA